MYHIFYRCRILGYALFVLDNQNLPGYLGFKDPSKPDDPPRNRLLPPEPQVVSAQD